MERQRSYSPSERTQARYHPLTLDEVHRLLAALREDRWFAMVFLELGTGLRRGELLALRWQDVDLQAGLLHVRQTLERVRNHAAPGDGQRTQLIFQTPKTALSRRTIPLPSDIVEVLKHHKARQAEEKLLLGQAYEDRGLIVCQPNGKTIDPRTLNGLFTRLLKRAGVPHIRVHNARHTFATLMLELGESPKTVQTMLAHTKIATTLDIYSHVSLDLEKRAAAKLNAALRAQPSTMTP